MIVLAPGTIFWSVATVLLSWLAPARLRMPAVIISTLVFLAWNDPLALITMVALSTITIGALTRVRHRGYLTLGVIAILCTVLIAFKISSSLPEAGRMAMPLGLSYMTFRLIHLLIESYVGRLTRYTTADVIAYLFFLPTLPVGPIHRFPDFQRDLRRRRLDSGMIGQGMERVLHGYAKLVILRNTIVTPWVLPWLEGWRDGTLSGDIVASSGQWIDLYVSFSGCSDLAVGLTLIMGFRIMENFHYPFLATSIPDFWRRWHISLTLWCRDYVFTPIAAATRRPLWGVVGAMIVIGFWHELSVRYLIWGVYHAAGILLWQMLTPAARRLIADDSPYQRVLQPLGNAVTLLFVIASFPVTSRLDSLIRVAIQTLW